MRIIIFNFILDFIIGSQFTPGTAAGDAGQQRVPGNYKNIEYISNAILNYQFGSGADVGGIGQQGIPGNYATMI